MGEPKISVITLVYDDALRAFVRDVQARYREELRGIYDKSAQNIVAIIALQKDVREYIMSRKDHLTYVKGKRGLFNVAAEESEFGISNHAKPDMFVLFAAMICDVDRYASFQECLDDLAKIDCGEEKLDMDEDLAEWAKCGCSNRCRPFNMVKMQNPKTEFAVLIGVCCAVKYALMTPAEYAKHRARINRKAADKRKAVAAADLAAEQVADKARYGPAMDRARLKRTLAAWREGIAKAKRMAAESIDLVLENVWRKMEEIKIATHYKKMTEMETVAEPAVADVAVPVLAAGMLACLTCAKPFHAHGTFKTCYKCNMKKQSATCEGCGKKFDGKDGLYTKCFNCKCNTTCTVCSKRFDGKGKYTKCYGC